MSIIKTLSSLIWGVPTVVLLLSFGVYFGIKLKNRKLLSFTYVFNTTFGSLNLKKSANNVGLSPLGALATALGGTVGVGSITGVAVSIKLGGAGSIFWLWICSAIGMFLKYAEVFISHRHKKRFGNRFIGGAMLCLRDIGFARTSAVFSLLCAVAALGSATVQSNAISLTLSQVGIRPLISAVLISSCVMFIVLGGKEKISQFNTVAVPFFSLSFVLICFIVLLINIKSLPVTLLRIISEAFGIRQAASGFSVGLFLNALKVGTVRGTFSHEAGMGSSAIAHASASEPDPHIQGLWGVSEVFVDSFIVSTLTALCILCSGFDDVGKIFTFFLGSFGRFYFTTAIAVFAFAAIISWVYYAESALFIFKRKRLLINAFKIFIVASVFTGALTTAEGAFLTADLFNGLMIFPNLFLLYKLRSEIVCAGKA